MMTNYEGTPVDRQQLSEAISKQIPAYDIDELEQTMKAAREEGDIEMIRRVENECRARDRWDDTDPRYNYLAQECLSAIELVQGGRDG